MSPNQSRRGGSKAAILRAVYNQPNHWARVEMLERRTLLSVSFGAATAYPVGNGPAAITTADLRSHEGINNIDIITANEGGNSISVLLGNGNGTFAPAVSYPTVGGSPSGIAVGDINGDGIPDIVTTDFSGDDVSIFYGNGDGTFKAAKSYYAGNAPIGVTIADLTGDNHMDIAVADAFGDTAGVLINNGNGTFQSLKTYPVGNHPTSITAAVLGSSNHPDLVVGDDFSSNGSGSTVSVLPGNGDGTFKAQEELNVLTNPLSVSVGDINGDNHPDILADYSLFLGNGDGTFQAAQPYSGGGQVVDTLTDIDGDHKLDIVTDLPAVALGNGDGTFQAAQSFSLGYQIEAVATGDFNGDGKPDLALAAIGKNQVAVMLNTSVPPLAAPVLSAPANDGVVQTTEPAFSWASVAGATTYRLIVATNSSDLPRNPTATTGGGSVVIDTTTSATDYSPPSHLANGSTYYWEVIATNTSDGGTWSAIRQFTIAEFSSNLAYPVPAHSQALTLVDLRGDGKQDIVTATASGSIGVLLGNGDGTFGAPASISDGLGNNAGTIVSLASADLNGHVDLIVSQESDQVSILLGNGDGTFESAEVLTLNHKVSAIAVDDINGDGKPDLIVGYNYGGGAAFLGNGNGTFGAAKTFSVGFCAVSSISVAQVYVASNHPDLVIGDQNGEVYLLAGNGDGTFGSAHTIYSYDSSYSFTVTTGDVNNDGNVDVILVGADGSIDTFLGYGDGNFRSHLSSRISGGAGSTVLADINGDGNLDLIAANAGYDSIGISLGNGNGTFAPSHNIGFGCQPGAVAVADVNNDHRPDIVELSIQSNTAGVLLSAYSLPGTAAHFRPGPTTTTTDRPYTVATADFNGDGINDAVTAIEANNQIEAFPGLGDGQFGTGKFYSVPNDPTFVMTADVNGDGKPDIVVASSLYGTVSVLVNNGNGTFAAPITTMVPNGVSYGVDAIAAADFNGDHKLDLVVADSSTAGYATVLFGNGDGTFEAPRKYALYSMGGCDSGGHAVAFGVAVGDFNGDNRSDFAVLDSYNDQVDVFLNNGSGGFGSPSTYAVGNYPASLAVGSLHGDGTQDIVTANSNSKTISVLLSNGDGSFATAVNYYAGNDPTQVVLNDVNGDGKTDILVLNEGSGGMIADVTPDVRSGYGQLDVFLGNGDGMFQNRNVIALSNNATSLAAADLNGDGQPDLVVANGFADSLSSYINTYAFANAPQSANFTMSANVATANGPGAIASGELTADGHADLVVADSMSNVIQVFLGNGDGSFKPPVNYSVANDPTSVLIADVNGDGKADIVVASAYSKDITVFLGNGDGTFKPPIVTSLANYSMSYGTESIASGDFNGDKKTDLAVATGSGNSILVLLGNGDGTFTVGGNYHNIVVGGPTGHAYAVTTGDVNGDKKTDIVASDSTEGEVYVLLGNGDGTFKAPVDYAVGSYPTAVALVDLNGDKNLDIVTANEYGNSISVLLGNGDGTFGAAHDSFAGQYPFELATGDFNGDGRQDVAVVNAQGNYGNGPSQVSVFVGNGDGSFKPLHVIGVGNESYSLVAADINGDGKPDLVASNYQSNTLSALLNNYASLYTAPGGHFSRGENVSGNHPDAIATGDLNKDGNSDFVLANQYNDTIQIFLGNGDGTFHAGAQYSVANDPTSVVIADINHDGNPDIVVGSAASDTVTVFLGNGNGTFKPGITTVLSNVGFSAGPEAIAVADFNGDRNPDLVIAGGTDDSVSVLYGNGDGTFQSPLTISLSSNGMLQPLDGSSGGDALAVAVGDLNGDYHPDIVVVDSENNQVDVLLNNAGGSFSAATTYSVGIEPDSVALADLTGDGSLDIVVANKYSNNVTVLLNNRFGHFSVGENFAAGNYPTAVAVADLNGDGSPDIIVTNGQGDSASSMNTASVLLGNGDSTFAAPAPLIVGNEPVALAVADFTGDGKPDIVTANAADNGATTLINHYTAAVAMNGSGTISNSAGMVTVGGTPESDTASVTFSNGNIIIDINGNSESLPFSSVHGLNINLEGGNDSLTLDLGGVPCTINGGAGNDTLMISNSGGASLNGGSGNDFIVAHGVQETLFGDTGNDTLIGGGPGSMLFGSAGNDMIIPHKLDESVRGGSGSDTIQSMKGGDSLRGGLGDDIFIDFDAGHGDSIDGGLGLNFAQNNPMDSMANIFEIFDPARPAKSPSNEPMQPAATPADAGASVAASVSGGILRIIGTSAGDTINVTSDGTNIDVTANGNPMTPVAISGLSGIRVNGEAGSDTIFIDLSVSLPTTLVGNGGNDSLVGGGGDNVIIGGNGNDTMVGGAGMNLLTDGSRGSFTDTSGGNDLLEGGPGYSIADFSRRTDNLFLSNDGKADSGDAPLGEKVTIDSSISAMWGGTGSDTIIGTTPGEFLSGGAGKDSIHGGGAGDLLVGGLGADTVIVAAEPVTLFLRDGIADDYGGVSNSAEDILSIDLGLDSVIPG